MRIVVMAAHPDDELLGVGATLARHARAGDEVHGVVLSEGATSRYQAGMQQTLEDAGRQAGKKLGLASIRFERFPDQQLDTVPLIQLTQKIETILEELDPEILYTHFAGDVNADHGLVAQATWTACRPYRFPQLRRLAAFETPSSTEWGLPGSRSAFQPGLFMDVSDTLETKLEAFSCYASELRDYPHPRSIQALRERARYWGSQVGRSAVEPFILLREIA